MRIVNHQHTENNHQRRGKPGAAHVANTFRRATCARCEEPVIALGAAIRVDRVEGGFEIIHLCAECATSGAFLALKRHAEAADLESQRRRFTERRPADRKEAA
jgi:RNase P subunit RPR2